MRLGKANRNKTADHKMISLVLSEIFGKWNLIIDYHNFYIFE